MRTSTLYFHPEVDGKKASRITFAISPLRDSHGALTLLANKAVCRHPDKFNKEVGRSIALNKAPINFTVHELPKWVADVMNSWQKELRYTANDFAWLSLRFV